MRSPSAAAAALTLADIPPGEIVRVMEVDTNNDFARRLLEFGVFEGVDVRVVRRAPTGDPIEIEVFGSHLSLRRNEADVVRVAREG